MKVIYFIQTHSNPNSIYRLVNIIKKSSPSSFVLISHDFTNCKLDTSPLQNIPGVEVITLNGKGKRGDFSMIQGYLDACEWIFSRNIEFDWLYNITGQDYPTQPLSWMEKLLAETKYDGFLNYFEAFSTQSVWSKKEGVDRYLYHYWRFNINVPLWIKEILRLPRFVVNSIQPFFRIYWSFDCLMIGYRAKNHPFNQNFICYGGYYFTILSKKCTHFLYNFTKQNSEVVDYYKKTCVPVESFVQTVLVNSKLFNLCNDNKRYFDFIDTRHGQPRILTIKDYPLLIKDDIHFARKFDTAKDSQILNMLDTRILSSSDISINESFDLSSLSNQ